MYRVFQFKLSINCTRHVRVPGFVTFRWRIANTKREPLPWGPREDFGRTIFQKKFSLGFHIFKK